MADKSDSDSLEDLFTTKRRSKGTEKLLVEKQTSDSTKTSAMEVVQNNSEKAKEAIVNPEIEHTRDLHTNTPVVNLIMREARRELSGLGHKTTDVSEEAVAAAVDKAAQSRGVQIDDIVRAEIIVHLAQDLVGWCEIVGG